jgi:hypothetical protein
MKKSVKRMGTEAMCWEMVRIEVNLEACQTFKTTFLHTIQQMPLECPEVSGAIMSAMHKVENDQANGWLDWNLSRLVGNATLCLLIYMLRCCRHLLGKSV